MKEKVIDEISFAFDALRQLLNNKELTFSKLNSIGISLKNRVNEYMTLEVEK